MKLIWSRSNICTMVDPFRYLVWRSTTFIVVCVIGGRNPNAQGVILEKISFYACLKGVAYLCTLSNSVNNCLRYEPFSAWYRSTVSPVTFWALEWYKICWACSLSCMHACTALWQLKVNLWNSYLGNHFLLIFVYHNVLLQWKAASASVLYMSPTALFSFRRHWGLKFNFFENKQVLIVVSNTDESLRASVVLLHVTHFWTAGFFTRPECLKNANEKVGLKSTELHLFVQEWITC